MFTPELSALADAYIAECVARLDATKQMLRDAGLDPEDPAFDEVLRAAMFAEALH